MCVEETKGGYEQQTLCETTVSNLLTQPDYINAH